MYSNIIEYQKYLVTSIKVRISGTESSPVILRKKM